MRQFRTVIQTTAIAIGLSSGALGQVTLSYDLLDGADPGFVDTPLHLAIVDIHVDVAPTDAWTVAAIAGGVQNSALLHYSPEPDNPGTTQLEYLFSPGVGPGLRTVTFLSAPHPRNADIRFTAADATDVGRFCPGGPTALASATAINVYWYQPGVGSGSPSRDGYIMRAALDLTFTPYAPAQCGVYDPMSPPAGAVPLFVADQCELGMAAGTFDVPTAVSLPWGVYAVSWGVLGEFLELDDGLDAPELPGFADRIIDDRFEHLARIFGDLGTSDVDLYALRIDDPQRFSATTMGGTSGDTQLFLFDADGRALVYSDNANGQIPQSLITPQFVNQAGMHYLAVSRYNRDPVNSSNQFIWFDAPRDGERTPNGPGANNPFLAGWAGGANPGGNYSVFLTGATTLCAGDVSGDGLIDLTDLSTQLSNFGAGSGARWNQGNLDGDGDVDLGDLTELLSRFGLSCQ